MDFLFTSVRKDLLRWMRRTPGEDFSLTRVMRGPFFVPDTKPVDDLLGDAADDLALLDAGERFPQVVEAVQRGAALDDEAADVALGFNENGLRALARGGNGATTVAATMIAAKQTMKIVRNLYSCFRNAMAPFAIAPWINFKRLESFSSNPKSTGTFITFFM